MAPAAGHVVTRPEPVRVGDYRFVPFGGLWFLTGDDDRPVSTILDMGEGVWRARTPEGEAQTFQVPPDTEDPALYVARRLVDG